MTTIATASIRYRFGRFELQPDERRLLADGVPINLGTHAFDLLVTLVDRAGHLVTKPELLKRVWVGVVVEENSLQAQISALRKIIGQDAIATVSGQGYRFVLTVLAVTEPAAASALPQNNLPQALTSFIGREKEIAEIRHCLTSARLLTLTGAGGCGKTRLALQVAGTLQGDYPGGVRLVELAPLGNHALVAQAVAKVLAIETLPGRDIVETLVEWLAPRRMVLVLDNAEHVLDACASLVEALLRRCRHLLIVATSRERLRIDGELTYRVPSLSVPAGVGVEDILASEAARLFIDRARLQRQDFEPTGKDAVALASICRRLDGIALAIELAAPQVRMMTLEELNARLDDRFAVLTGGSRTALPRHRTLRSLIDWSHELLSGPEQAMLRRVSAFAGSWTLEGSERVCSGNGIERGDVLNLLGALEDKSLVFSEAKGDNARFGMLETVRDYAQIHLRASGDSAAVHDRLTEYVIDLAAGLEAPQDSSQHRALRQLDAEHDNVRVALAWCERNTERSLKGLRLAASLSEFWRFRGPSGEGLAWLERLQAPVSEGERGETHAMALSARGTLLSAESDQAAAAVCLHEAVQLWRRLGDRRQTARSLLLLTYAEWFRGNAEAARAACAEALPISREFGDLRNVADALAFSAEMARVAGDYDAAQTFLDECLTVSRGIGVWATAAAHAYLASLEYSRGAYARARSTWRKSLPGYREFGDRSGACGALTNMAMASQELGEVAEATSCLHEAWEWMPEGNENELLYWLEHFADLLVARDCAADAVRVWGCVEGHREERGLERPDSKRHLRMLDAARGGLQDPTIFKRTWGEGRLWSLDQARQFAHDFFERLHHAPAAEGAAHDTLVARE
jgi:predicted ATPase/DNA-binding winged helix-turn-helix (wHTH) protein